MPVLVPSESVNTSERSTNLQMPQWPHWNIPLSCDKLVSQFLFVVLMNSDWTKMSLRLLALLATKWGLEPTISLRSVDRVRICQFSFSILFKVLHCAPNLVIILTGPSVVVFCIVRGFSKSFLHLLLPSLLALLRLLCEYPLSLNLWYIFWLPVYSPSHLSNLS